MGVYSKGGTKERLERWKECMEEREGKITMIEGDWNARTGEEGWEWRGEEGDEEGGRDRGTKW